MNKKSSNRNRKLRKQQRLVEGLAYNHPQYFGTQYQRLRKEKTNAEVERQAREQEERDAERERLRNEDLRRKRFSGGEIVGKQAADTSSERNEEGPSEESTGSSS